MYKNLEEKLKVLAIIIVVIMTIGGLIGGIFIFAEADEEMFIVGVLLIAAGFFVGWISSWPIYALAEILGKLNNGDKTNNSLNKDELEKAMKEIENKYNASSVNPLG